MNFLLINKSLEKTHSKTTKRKGKKMIVQQHIDQLSQVVRGKIVTRDSKEYDNVRKIWNNMIDRYPSVIIQCHGSADVSQCIKIATEHNINFSIRSGGHHIAGNSICDDGLMIDLSTMKSVFVDQKQKVAYVEPGATLGDIDHETQHYGLATSLGINSTTGVAGLTLGGGFGWLSRKYGLTVDNLVAAEIIIANGESLRVSKHEHADLFWAIRGGGGNFGIVTRFELQLHSVGPEVFSGLIVLPFESAKGTLQQYREYAESLPDDISVWVVARKAPPLPFLDQKLHGKKVIIVAFCYLGDEQEGMKLIEPIRKSSNPYGELLTTMPYKNWQQAFDGLLTSGARNYWKSHNFESLSDDTINSIITATNHIPDPQCEIFIAQMGGFTGRQAIDKTAYTHRKTNFIMNIHGRWESKNNDKACIDWARALFNSVEPYAMGGAYVNFMTQDENDRVPSAYGDNYQRLSEIKQQYDPNNIFNINHNIKPNRNSQ